MRASPAVYTHVLAAAQVRQAAKAHKQGLQQSQAQALQS